MIISCSSNGSDEILGLICQLYLTKGDEVIIPKNSFLMYEIYSKIHNAKIIKSKTDELKSFYSNQINITDEIQKFISLEIKTSIRELVGALNRIVSFTRIYNKVPSLSEVKIVLKDLLNLL